MNDKIRVRMAPSPTGFLHVGGLRTALFNFLFAKKNGGKFVLRIEDTDRARVVPGALMNIVQTLADFKIGADEGLYWDGRQVAEKGEFGPYLQSKRTGLYKKYAEELVQKRHAYYCFCTTQRLEELRKHQAEQKLPPKYDKQCLKLSADEVAAKLKTEPYVIRLNVPADKTIRFTDLVHGEIEISTNDLDDQILLKADGFPTYHLAVVVDDYLMKITHVIRGEEWIPSTPKHILLYSSFGWESPRYVHLPLLLSKSRKKLSKRGGDVAVKDFLDLGYMPEALLNFVALLGWNPKTEQEIFTLDELVEQFSLEKLNKAGAVFDLEKLDWLNGLYIRKMDLPALVERVRPYLQQAGIKTETYPKEFVEKIVSLERERLKKLSEIGERVKYFFSEPEYDTLLLIWKKSSKAIIRQNLAMLSEFVTQLPPESFERTRLEREIKDWIESQTLKAGEVLWPLRVALTGLEASPGPFEIMEALAVLPGGREIIGARLKKALEKLAE